MNLLLNEWDEGLIGGRIHHRRTGTSDWLIGCAPANAARVNYYGGVGEQHVQSRPKVASPAVAAPYSAAPAPHQSDDSDIYAAVSRAVTAATLASQDATPYVRGGGGSFDGGGASGDF